MIDHKKAETISLVTLLTLVIAAVLIVGGVSYASNLFKGPVLTNEGQVNSFATKTNQLLTNYATNPTQSSQETFVLGTDSLLLFFSKGTGPIFLSHKFTGTGALVTEDIIQEEHYLKFERPETCNNKACVCHCQNTESFWKRTDEEPYLERNDLLVITDKSLTGYNCKQAVCEEIVSEQPVVFTNGRGQDTEFTNQANKLVEEYNDREQFYPFMFDIPLLIQTKAKNDGNIFFSYRGGVGEDYHRFKQDKDYVSELIDNYYWEGGVVLGGSGAANGEEDGENHILRPVQLSTRLETYPDAPGVIGVCNFPKCLYATGLAAAKKTQKAFVEEQKFASDLQPAVNKFATYLSLTVATQIRENNFDEAQFLTKVNTYFSSFDSEAVDVFLFLSKSEEGLDVYGQVGTITSEKTHVDISYPIYESGETAISPLKIQSVHLEKQLIEIYDVAYALKYDASQKNIILIPNKESLDLSALPPVTIS